MAKVLNACETICCFLLVCVYVPICLLVVYIYVWIFWSKDIHQRDVIALIILSLKVYICKYLHFYLNFCDCC
jgi:hypothetical protein